MTEDIFEATKYIGRKPYVSEVKKYFRRNGSSDGEFIWYIENEDSPCTLSVTITLNENDTLTDVRPSKLKVLSDMGRCRFENVDLTELEEKYICSILNSCFPESCSAEEKLYGAPIINRIPGAIYDIFEISASEIEDADIADAQSFFCEYAKSVEAGRYSFVPGDMLYSASVLQSQQELSLRVMQSYSELMHHHEDDLKKWVHFAFAYSLLFNSEKITKEVQNEIKHMSMFISQNYEAVLQASFRGANIFYLDTITERLSIKAFD